MISRKTLSQTCVVFTIFCLVGTNLYALPWKVVEPVQNESFIPNATIASNGDGTECVTATVILNRLNGIETIEVRCATVNVDDDGCWNNDFIAPAEDWIIDDDYWVEIWYGGALRDLLGFFDVIDYT